MFSVILSCVLLMVLTTLFHYEVLRGLHLGLPKLRIPSRTKLLVTILVAFVAHVVEIVLYAVTLFALIRYMGVGNLGTQNQANFLECLYFSAETYTSLGLGDIHSSGPIRLIAGAASLNGLLLIAWSASFVYLAMEKFWASGSPAR